MLKKFFISMLGSMAALWLTLLILPLVAVVALMSVGLSSMSSSSTPDDGVLYIDLSGEIVERESAASIRDVMQMIEEPSGSLESIVKALSLAAGDKKIKGVMVNCGGSSLGVASRGELAQALAAFKESGKFVYAYADNYEQGDYYTVCAADSVFLNPVGSVNIHGIGASYIFYKDVLDKLGIGIDVVRVGSFKSAVEPYMRMDMSEASRLQTQVFVSGIWGNVASAIASSRGADRAGVDMWADSLCLTWAPAEYLARNIVSATRYRSEVEAMLRAKLDLDEDDDLPYVTPADYLAAKSADLAAKSSGHIAVLYAVGDIVDSGEGGIVATKIVPEIEALTRDDNVKGLVLRVNSGGGSAFASEQIWHALEDFKAAGKPFYVSMGDYAASGGYYISCGADKIFSDPTTLTGSIGIFGVIPNAQTLLREKIGLGYSSVESNANASFPSLFVKPTAGQIAAMQGYVERGYDTFTSRVAQGRSIPVDSVKAIGGGRVWDGASALEIGLVDELGSLSDAVSALALELGVDASDVVSYPEMESGVFDTLLKQARSLSAVDSSVETLRRTKAYMDFVERVRTLSPLQARMPVVVID